MAAHTSALGCWVLTAFASLPLVLWNPRFTPSPLPRARVALECQWCLRGVGSLGRPSLAPGSLPPVPPGMHSICMSDMRSPRPCTHSHTHTHSHTLTCSHRHPHSHLNTLSHKHALTYLHIYTGTLTHTTHIHTLTHSLVHTLIHGHSLTHTQTHFVTHSLPHTQSHAHTFTVTHPHPASLLPRQEGAARCPHRLRQLESPGVLTEHHSAALTPPWGLWSCRSGTGPGHTRVDK